jgi:hypothetical protein
MGAGSHLRADPRCLDLVAADAGIGFVKKSTAERVHEPRVTFRELSGPRLFINTGVAYRTDESFRGVEGPNPTPTGTVNLTSLYSIQRGV